jgi:hypothetical protein
MKIRITVEGGIVQAVESDTEGIECEIIDFDRDAEEKKISYDMLVESFDKVNGFTYSQRNPDKVYSGIVMNESGHIAGVCHAWTQEDVIELFNDEYPEIDEETIEPGDPAENHWPGDYNRPKPLTDDEIDKILIGVWEADVSEFGISYAGIRQEIIDIISRDRADIFKKLLK